MPVLAVGDVIRVTWFNRLFAQRILMVCHLRCTTAPTGTNILAQLDEITSVVNNNTTFPLQGLQPLTAPDVSFDSVRAQRVSNPRSVYSEAAVGINGTHADQARTANVALSVEKRSLHPGRRGIGRIQVGGLPATKLANGMWDSTFVNDVNTWAQGWLDPLPVQSLGGIYKWIIPTNGPVTSDDDIIALQAKSTVRDMRRRTVGVGI